MMVSLLGLTPDVRDQRLEIVPCVDDGFLSL